MKLECGFWEIDSLIKERNGHRYFVCRHRFNPSKVELVFIKNKELRGDKNLCLFIDKEILNNKG